MWIADRFGGSASAQPRIRTPHAWLIGGETQKHRDAPAMQSLRVHVLWPCIESFEISSSGIHRVDARFLSGLHSGGLI